MSDLPICSLCDTYQEGYMHRFRDCSAVAPLLAFFSGVGDSAGVLYL